MTILFVDDSPEFLKVVRELCTIVRPDRKVVCFVDAFEAMNFINQNHKEIRGVITDYQMDKYGMSGTIIVDKCKEKAVPVFVCTAHGQIKLSFGPDVAVIDKCSLKVLLDALKEL